MWHIITRLDIGETVLTFILVVGTNTSLSILKLKHQFTLILLLRTSLISAKVRNNT